MRQSETLAEAYGCIVRDRQVAWTALARRSLPAPRILYDRSVADATCELEALEEDGDALG